MQSHPGSDSIGRRQRGDHRRDLLLGRRQVREWIETCCLRNIVADKSVGPHAVGQRTARIADELQYLARGVVALVGSERKKRCGHGIVAWDTAAVRVHPAEAELSFRVAI